MIIDIKSYNIPLATPIQLKSHHIEKKEGFLVSLKEKNEQAVLSELSFLPHFSQGSLDQLLLEYEATASLFLKDYRLFLKDKKKLLQFFLFHHIHPSLAFCFYSLIHQSGLTHHNLSLPLQRLLTGTFEEMMRKIDLNIYKEAIYLKIKITSLNLKEAITVIKKLAQFSKRKKKLRIDAGGLWTYEAIKELFFSFEKNLFDYIEDPFLSFSALEKLSNKDHIPIAADELSRLYPLKDLLFLKSLKAIVIKPFLDPNYLFLQPLPDSIAKVFSSSYETPIGLYNIACAAQSYSQTSHGLDTFSFFPMNFYNKYLTVKNSQMIFTPQNFYSKDNYDFFPF